MSVKPRAGTVGSKRHASPAQLAANGHIAARLRERLKATGMAVSDLNAHLGLPRAYSLPYKWTAGMHAPGGKYREQLSKLLNIPIADLTPRGGKQRVAAVVTRPPPAIAPAPKPPAEALSFTMAQDGTSRLRLDITMSGSTALLLMAKLIDLDLIPKPETLHVNKPSG